MQQRALADLTVGAIGLGGMPMSIEGRPERSRSVATIHAALDAGVTLIDTADAYHLYADEVGHNEELIAGALRSWGGDATSVLVATKGGHLRPGDGSWTPTVTRPTSDRRPRRRRDGSGSTRSGSTSSTDPTRRCRTPSRSAPWSSCSTRASSCAPVSPTPPSPRSTRPTRCSAAGSRRCRTSSHRPSARAGELEHCAALGIAFLPWSPLGGISKAADLGSSHAAFAEVAKAHGVSPQQVALAWELSLAEVVIPIPGASRPASIEDSVLAADLELNDDELARLSAN